MHTFGRLVGAVLIALLLVPLGPGTVSAGVPQAGIVTDAPDGRTPHVLDNTVLDLEEIGGRIVVAGTFTQVRDAGVNGGTTFDQPYVFAFDPVSGAVDQAFRPVVSGNVNTIAPGPDGTVYLGGTFATVNGETARNLVQVSLATGARVPGFAVPGINGAVNDLAVTGGRLLLAGFFGSVSGVPHGGLASVHPVTGAVDDYMGVDLYENHNWPRGTARAPVGVRKMDVSPDGSRLAVIGNFRSADGLPRDQLALLRLDAGSAVVDPDWRTERYTPECLSSWFDFYVRDVDFTPDGSSFVVVTTGAKYDGTLCDTAAAWDPAARGQAIQPRWIAVTGGDTLLSVAASDSAVYVGGHQRWMNNPSGHDTPGPGAVPRPGIAALDPRTGVPLSWNPGRNPRGHGAEALLTTASGLYVGSDTEYFGDREHSRPRLGYFPLAGGTSAPAEAMGSLPADVFLVGRTGVGSATDTIRARFFDGTTAGTDRTVDSGGTVWSRARGAVLVDDVLFYGYPGGDGSYALHRRSFDGRDLGPAERIDPYNDPYWSTVTYTRHGATEFYRGVVPTFYEQLARVTGMAYRDGRLYYSLSDSTYLYYRYFSPESGIVSQDQFVAAGPGFLGAAGMFLSRDDLYVATVGGDLRRFGFAGGTWDGTAPIVSGPSRDGRDWRSRGLVLAPPANQPPVAAFVADCLGLTCALDGAASADVDGTAASYRWDFGDGATAAGAAVQHAFGAPGAYAVTLTVTDDDGASTSTTQQLTVTVQEEAGIGFRASAAATARPATQVSVEVPASVRAGDGLVLVLSVNSGLTGMVPAGWELAGTQTDGGSMTTQLFSRVASAGDAGSTVTVDVPGEVSSALGLQLLAYSGTSTSGPIASVTGAIGGSGTSHTTPVTQAETGSVVLSMWSDKQAAAREFTAPGAVEVRSSLAGAGNGDVATLVADGGAPVPAGQVGGLTATVPTSSSRSTAMTVVLAPGDGTPPADAAPEAVISSTCAELTCEFDGSGSTDAEGPVASFAWDFGDGTTATQPQTSHTFAAAGEYEVALTVTDAAGQATTESATVTVAAPPAAGAGIGLRGSAGSAARPVRAISVDVPQAVRAGDGLVLVLSVNSGVTGTTPAGWEPAGSASDGGQMTTQVFSRVASAGDAGSTVTVDLPVSSAVTLQLLAYSGTSAEGPVTSVTGAGGGRGLTAHTTPLADAVAGSWVLSVWSDKAPHERELVPPAELTERSNIAGVGNGDVATLVADSGAPVPAGQVGGLTATVATASSRATTLTVVLAPAGSPPGAEPGDGGTPDEEIPPVDAVPEAVISSSCAELTCEFDGSGSTDGEGAVASFAWEFGDGVSGSGAVVEHTFAAAGDYEVALAVTDSAGQVSRQTATVTVAAAPTVGAGIGLRGSAGTAARPVRAISVDVPDAVQAGDGLVLVLSVNSGLTGTVPVGWELAGSVTDGGQMTTQVFARVATAEDAGSTVTVDVGGSSSSALTLQLMAYSGTSAEGPVASVTGAGGGRGLTAHTTPTADAAAGSWVLSVWSDKAPHERLWVPPAELAERSNIAGAGNGDVATLVADSGAPVPAGQVGGLTATVATASSRATTLTVVLAAAG
ncbi:PKD domain-containing protein [Blastococcus colisei]|uniref:PKD domain-containing protein n=1 Tax=Blastococcus colisei TaxID=1564162 RepID=A0A543P0E5_9ACTN|nr:PKD domain-containing protein [Blastococcus colisei]TQN37551.1 PKD domain-containing protein [Blastococcus colisei]